MIACICNAITCQNIRDCISDCEHIETNEVFECLNIGSSCGICKKEVEQMIDKIKEQLCQENC